MNSHERRVCERSWPFAIDINHDKELLNECSDWLWKNFGTCKFNTRRRPRWCFRLNYVAATSFARYAIGAQIYFRKERDYLAFLLKWDS